jgi:hypothetical protein
MRGRIRGLAVLSSAALLVAGGVTTAVVASAAAGQAPVLLSRNKPVTASTQSGAFVAKNAVDGKATTRWASSAGKDPSWIYVDLGSTAKISRVRLQWDKSCAVSYRVETSANHTAWTSIFSTTKGDGGVDDLTVTGTGRYVRMIGTKRCRADASHGYSLQEFDVYGTLGGGGGDKTPPTTPGKPVLNSVDSSSVTVHWTASTDNVGVTAYDVLANGEVAGTVAGSATSGSANGLNPDTDYSIQVVARDAAGNKSTASPSLGVHTSKGGGGGNPYGDPHLVSMFDGKSLNGWTQSKDGLWSALNGTIHGNGTARGWIYYNKQQTGTFRWIFTLRQVSGNHAPTVLIWGTTNPIRDALSAIQFQPPNGGHWDYRPGHNNGGSGLFKQIPHTKINSKDWAQCELIGNMTTGIARMACCPLGTAVKCKAFEVLQFKDKTAGRVGPLAIQIHNGGIHDEYKNLYIESPVVQSPDQFITTS